MTRRRSRLLRAALIAVVAAQLHGSPARAGEWHPLDALSHWRYAIDGGGTVDVTVTGTITLLGRSVAVEHFSGGIDDGLDQYWLDAPDGSPLLAGFNRPADGFGLAYDPPLMLLEVPPSLGASWTTDATAYSLPDLTLYATLHIQWSVMEDVVLPLPIGNIPSFGVGQVLEQGASATFSSSSGFTVDGRRRPDGPAIATSNATDWYARNLGIVQYLASTYFRLQSFDRPDAALSSSWGRLKQLYR